MVNLRRPGVVDQGVTQHQYLHQMAKAQQQEGQEVIRGAERAVQVAAEVEVDGRRVKRA